MDEWIKVLDMEQDGTAAYVGYIKLFCPACGSSWGCHVEHNQIKECDLLCRKCAAEKYWQEQRQHGQ